MGFEMHVLCRCPVFLSTPCHAIFPRPARCRFQFHCLDPLSAAEEKHVLSALVPKVAHNQLDRLVDFAHTLRKVCVLRHQLPSVGSWFWFNLSRI
jgi:hypothetical protein